MTQVIGELVIADPVTLVIEQPTVVNLAVDAPAPVVLAVTPPATQMIVTAGQGPVGPQGVPGPQGAQGPPGIGSIGDVVTLEFAITSNGAQTKTLPHAPATTYSVLCINGLRQSRSAYTISGTTLTLPSDLLLTAGDLVFLDYA